MRECGVFSQKKRREKRGEMVEASMRAFHEVGIRFGFYAEKKSTSCQSLMEIFRGVSFHVSWAVDLRCSRN